MNKVSDIVSTNIYFGTLERREKLLALARAQGISQSELVRRWIDSEGKMDKELKLCTACKWVQRNTEMERWDCVHVNRGQSPVDGKYLVQPCEVARAPGAALQTLAGVAPLTGPSRDCGPEGKWWEEKEVYDSAGVKVVVRERA